MTSSEQTVRDLAVECLPDLEGLVEKVLERLVAAEPPGFFDDSTTADLRTACTQGVSAVLSYLAGADDEHDQLDVPRRAGRRQVQQDLPLEGVLRAYRLGGQVIWERLVELARLRPPETGDALLDGASDVWRVIDLFSSAVGEGYRTEELALRVSDQTRRASLLAALLAGQGADPGFARDASRALELDGSAGYVCVVGLAGEGGGVALAAPEEGLRSVRIRSVWLSRPGGEVGLVPLAGVTLGRVQEALRGVARGRVGHSPVFLELAELPRAERLADLAAHLPGSPPSVRTVDSDLVAALAADSPVVAELIQERTVGRLVREAKQDADSLLETVRVFLLADGQLTEAAARSFLHRNTVIYRLGKIERLTGVSLRSWEGQLLWQLGMATHNGAPARQS